MAKFLEYSDGTKSTTRIRIRISNRPLARRSTRDREWGFETLAEVIFNRVRVFKNKTQVSVNGGHINNYEYNYILHDVTTITSTSTILV